jgi:myo-inositol-1(or 4)-monophosphatase
MIKDIIDIAKEAGEIIRNGFGKTLDIEYKTGESNLVTNIDKASEKHIIQSIQRKYKSHSILGEEGTNIRNDSEYLWVIDPLDGTTNFAHRLPIFSVSIGVLKNNALYAGVVYDVMNDIVYSAVKGEGSYANGEKLHVNSNEIVGHSVLVTGFPYNISENPDRALEKFSEMVKKTRAVRRLGSAAIDLCFVAKGVFDAFWEVYLHPWDMAAGMLILEEAGGKITDFSGKPTNIYTHQLLASNNVIHEKILDILQKA